MNGRMEAEAMAAEHEARNCQRWIPVSERLPEPYPQRIAVVLRTGKIVATHMGHDYVHGPFWSGIDNWFDVTHWMPLPPPPTECALSTTQRTRRISGGDERTNHDA